MAGIRVLILFCLWTSGASAIANASTVSSNVTSWAKFATEVCDKYIENFTTGKASQIIEEFKPDSARKQKAIYRADNSVVVFEESRELAKLRLDLNPDCAVEKIVEYIWTKTSSPISKIIYSSQFSKLRSVDYTPAVKSLDQIYSGHDLQRALKSQTEDRVKIAVLDSGVDYNTPEIAASIRRTTRWQDGRQVLSIVGYDFRDDDFLPFDISKHSRPYVFHHGTKVTSVIVQNPFEFEIIPVRISKEKIVESVEYAAQNGAQIINLSSTYNDPKYRNVFEEVITRHSNILFVVAAGNSADVPKNVDGLDKYPAALTISNLITVASLTESGNLSAKSNYGQHSVDIGATGENVEVTSVNGKKLVGTGTSLAAPQVTRIAGRMLKENPSLTAPEIKSLLIKSAKKIEKLASVIKCECSADEVGAIAAAKKYQR